MKIFLVDGSALVYRSHFAFQRQPLMNSHGEITSAAFGVANALVRLHAEENGEAIVAALDARGPTFRHELYADYKANRPPMPKDLAAQLPRVRELIASMGIPLLEVEGFEADDVLATLAREGAELGHEVWIYSADKDFVPLVRPGVGILRPAGRGGQEVYLDERGVVKRYGVRPAQFLDVLALTGDTSDNVPGVPGIGEKTAVKLIAQFESLERLMAHLSDKRISARQRQALTQHAEQLATSHRLLEVDENVPLDFDWNAAGPVHPFTREFRRLCRELEFFSILERMGSETESGEATSPAALGVRTAGSLLELDTILTELGSARPWVLATMTDGPDPHRSELLGVALAVSGEEAVFIPVVEGPPPAPQDGLFDAPEGPSLPWPAVRERLAPWLANADLAKVGAACKHDQIVLERYGAPVDGVHFDTAIASYLLAPERRQHGVEYLAAELLGEDLPPPKALLDGVAARDLREVPAERLADHAGRNAAATYRLWEVLRAQLEAEDLVGVMYELEMPLSQVLLRMEQRGIRLDVERLTSLAEELRSRLEALTQRIHELAGGPFNLNSPQQLQKILFTKLGLKPVKKTSSGYSTDVAVLTRLAEQHELPGLLLEYRQHQKLLSTYVEALPKLVNPATGCLHTNYNQTVAATGRLSSADPNLQNIPIRTELGRRIREAFVPRETGWMLLAADYSQIELRLMAHLSGDQAMREAFRRGEDIHARTAAAVNNVALEAVTDDMRRRAKAINFGLLYGMGPRALAQQTGVSTKEAQAFIDQYFARFPRVRAFIRDTIDTATAEREVRTLLGRRRRLPELASPQARQRAFGERIAVNTPIQGSAADIIKLAMIRLDRRLEQEDLDAHILLQVHDELILEVPRDQRERTEGLVREVMENVVELEVPLVVDVHGGGNWAEAHA